MNHNDRKTALRAEATTARTRLPRRDALSRRVWDRLESLPEYRKAQTVLYYVDAHGEVETQAVLRTELACGKRRVGVPFCVGDELELFRLENMDELVRCAFGILEPKPELRDLPEKRMSIDQFDLVVVPGVAFDRRGGRVGHGRAYYDRLLPGVRRGTPAVGLAFECQMYPEVPMLERDVFLDAIVTQRAVYRRDGS